MDQEQNFEPVEIIQDNEISQDFVEFLESSEQDARNDNFQQVPLIERSGNFIDLTPYFNLPVKQAAQLLGICTSTLSKQWKETTFGRQAS